MSAADPGEKLLTGNAAAADDSGVLRILFCGLPLLLAGCQQIPLGGGEQRIARSFDKLVRSVTREEWIGAPARRVRHGADVAGQLAGSEVQRTGDLAHGAAGLGTEVTGRTQRLVRRSGEIVDRQFDAAQRRLRQWSAGEALVLDQPAQRARGLRRAPQNLGAVLAIDGHPLPETGDPDRQTTLAPTAPPRGWLERVLRRIGI